MAHPERRHAALLLLVLLCPITRPQETAPGGEEGYLREGPSLPEEVPTDVPETLNLMSCFTPPISCPNENVTFHLYTRAIENSPYLLDLGNEQSLKDAPFVEDRPVKLLIHGYTGHRDFSPNTEIRPALLAHDEYNVISVDWGRLAAPPCYVQATSNVQLAGTCAAQLVDALVLTRGIKLRKIHVIGFSLGAQVAGQLARFLTVGKLRRITGLDPAMPLFASLSRSAVLDRSDAAFVDVMHTNAGNKGKYGPNGHVDFYVNGGAHQPGCSGPEVYDSASCSHGRAPMYYAESICSRSGFWGRECSSWMSYRTGLCSWTGAKLAVMGENADPKVHGSFFLDTEPAPPFALGVVGSAGSNDRPPGKQLRQGAEGRAASKQISCGSSLNPGQQ